MRIDELMSRKVETVTRETSLKEVAERLVRRGISGMPVCDGDGRLLGVVTEADILWKEASLSDSGGGFIDRLLASAYGTTDGAAASTAGDAMTSPAITVEPEASVASAARLMVGHRINRLPVVDGERLVGIVTRADLVRAYARSDEEIEREISEDVLRQTLWIDPADVSLVVFAGVVKVAGNVESRTDAELIEAYIRRVPGVVSVHSELRWRVDDRSHRTAVAAASLERKL